MTLFAPMWIIVVVVVFIVLISTSGSRRRREFDHARYDVKVCPQCGTSQPAHAGFCRECGRRLEV